jgi:Tfp pilus assembly protein PilN
MMVFNLLQYPALASQRRRIHRRWTSWAGLVVGGLAAVGLMSHVQGKQWLLEQERGLLASRLKQVENQLAADKALQAWQTTWQQQDAHIQLLRAQQQRWEALHLALLRETGPNTVQLQRLQLDAQTLELHGQAKDVQRMAQARARLSSARTAPEQEANWTLVSLVNAPANLGMPATAPLEFVWRTHWPQVGTVPVLASSARNLQSTDPLKERP